MKKIVMIATLALALTLQAFSQTIPTNGLVAYYPFNGNANDASGNGNNGTVEGATLTTNRFGLTNSAYYFDGNAEIILPLAAFTNMVQGTISTWVLLDSNSQGTFFSKQDDNVATYAMFTVGGYSNVHGYRTDATAGDTYFAPLNSGPLAASTNAVPTGVWSQVAVVFSATNCNLYINGALSAAYSGDFSVPDASATVTSIGAQEILGSYYYDFAGIMNDFRIYNVALSSNQIAQLYEVEASPGPLIISQPQNVSNLVGQVAQFTVTATNAASLSYQWFFVPATGFTNSPGQAGAYAELAGNFVYGAVVTNGGSGYGNIPSISFVGGNPAYAAGGYATVSNAMVTGITVTNAGSGYTTAPAVVIGPPDGLLSGQTNATLTISNIGAASAGDYYVVVSANGSSSTSSVASLTLTYAPGIAVNPAGYTGVFRGSGSLSVSASGTAPLSYQWSLDGTNLAGATNSSFNIASLNPTNTGAYEVEVTNLYGTATSSPANVYLAPDLTQPFGGLIALWGQNTTLAAGAIGSGPLSYQWYFNGAAIAGATGSNYDLGDIQFTNAGLYDVVVSSPYGSATNLAYQVVVNPANVTLGTCPIIYLTGTAGYTYTIQSTTNLANTNDWLTITNLTIPYTPYIWADTATDTTQPGNPKKFYRVLGGD